MDQTIDNDRIIKINIEEEMKSSYIDYSMSVIVARALPDVRDGFKPVHRRILYGMMNINNVSTQPYKKCARVVGEVLGKYHPHGDSSVYGALVRMAQDFSMRLPLVDGHGNFGSIDGDPPAAMRYTEVRMQKATEELGGNGRILLRKSGTEPVLRVMAEAGSDAECEENVDYIIAAMEKSGHLIEVKK